MTRDEPLPVTGLMAIAEESPARAMTEAEFRVFYEQTASRLRSYLRRLCGNEPLADDLLQDVYVRFLGASFHADTEAQTMAYLYRIATNLVRDHIRKHRREMVMESPPEPPGAGAPGSETLMDVRQMFARLRPREQSLLWLAHVQGLSHVEIARQTGVAERSVRVALFRARRRFADLLRRRGLMRPSGAHREGETRD
jgi:RNA polymerase sigma-70 factor (ECF subfamily)